MAAEGAKRLGSLGADVLCALDFAVLERRPAGGFECLETPPAWFDTSSSAPLAARGTNPPSSPHAFLEHFLDEAEAWWKGCVSGRLESEVWSEPDAAGVERYYRAVAVALPDSRRLLFVQHLENFARERLAPLQAARDAALDRVKLLREVEKKELLLHCIVHDLKGPLAGMLGTMSLLRDVTLGTERTLELAEIGIRQARKQESMIRTILEVFSLEVSQMEAFTGDPLTAPDLVRCAEELVELFRPAFERNGVRLEFEARGTSSIPVLAERDRLERVLANLLENALRHAPRGSTVSTAVGEADGRARWEIEDRGPGVPEALRSELFQKFVRDPASGGVAGLGLYSCRRNIERWGGSIGYDPRVGGGSRFWFEIAGARGRPRGP